MELFTGSDYYGAVAYQQAGYMTEPGFTAAEMQARDGKPADIPDNKVVRLPLPTFTATAEMAPKPTDPEPAKDWAVVPATRAALAAIPMAVIIHPAAWPLKRSAFLQEVLRMILKKAEKWCWK